MTRAGPEFGSRVMVKSSAALPVHPSWMATLLLSPVWEGTFIFSETHTLSRMCPETKQQLQTSIVLSPFPILAHPQAEQ